MNNVFEDLNNPENITDKYDLKGSTYKRISSPIDIKKGNPKKDLDFLNELKKLRVPKT